MSKRGHWALFSQGNLSWCLFIKLRGWIGNTSHVLLNNFKEHASNWLFAHGDNAWHHAWQLSELNSCDSKIDLEVLTESFGSAHNPMALAHRIWPCESYSSKQLAHSGMMSVPSPSNQERAVSGSRKFIVIYFVCGSYLSKSENSTQWKWFSDVSPNKTISLRGAVPTDHFQRLTFVLQKKWNRIREWNIMLLATLIILGKIRVTLIKWNTKIYHPLDTKGLQWELTQE